MMFNKDDLDGLIGVLVGIFIFKAMTSIDVVETTISNYPIPVIAVALILLFNRKKITNKILGGNNGRSN